MVQKSLNLIFFGIGICSVFELSLSHDVSRTKVLTADNFPSEIDKSASFVKFYAPWCSHCVKLAPIWDELAEMLNDDEGSRVQIAEVDCTQEGALCNEQDITGYPTLKFFKKGNFDGVKYRGPRDFPSFSTFINENLEDSEEEKESSSPVSSELNEDVLHATLSNGNHFVMFFAPWCGHSQKLAPVWEEFAESYKQDGSINVAKVDCTVYKNICNHYDVRAYPSLYWLQNGRKVEKYEGHKQIGDLKLFVEDMLKMKDFDNYIESEEKGDVTEDPSNTKYDESVIILNGDNFQDEISKPGLLFVKFYAPWCGHSQMLAPVWEELSKSFDNKVIRIAKVDCAVEKQLCNNQNIDGYPTLILYRGNGKEPIEYEGHRHKEFLREFIALHSHDEL